MKRDKRGIHQGTAADPGVPVRMVMRSKRAEVQVHLFDVVYGNAESVEDGMIQHLSRAEEEMMGILPNDEVSSSFGDASDFGQMDLPTENTEGNDGGNEEILELVTEGRMRRVVDPEMGYETIILSYTESELTGMEGSESSIIFRTDDPGLIHMVRTGSVSTALTFRAHCRAICTYNTPLMPFQVGIHGLTVDNRLLVEGRLTLEYIIEIRGAQAERCRMEMTITSDFS